MGFPVTVVLGASGRIGKVLRRLWPAMLPPEAEIRWQARRVQAEARPQEDWRILDPLAEPQALTAACSGAAALLCLAGAVPGRSGELADNARLALAAVEASARAAEQGQTRPSRVLLTSSAAVYGAGSAILREENTVHPANAYGAAKLEMEQQALARGEALGVPVTALRIGNIAGLDAILGGWKPGFILDQFPDGTTPRRSYIGVQSLAATLAALLHRPALPPILNLAQPQPIEMGALLQAAGRAYGLRPAPENAIPEVAFDLSLLNQTLGPDMPAPADPACLAAEWTLLEPDFNVLPNKDLSGP